MISLLAIYVPFRDPLWGGWDYWYLMLPPLALLVSLVYKSMRVENMRDVPMQTARAFLKFIISFVVLAAVLWVIVLILE